MLKIDEYYMFHTSKQAKVAINKSTYYCLLLVLKLFVMRHYYKHLLELIYHELEYLYQLHVLVNTPQLVYDFVLLPNVTLSYRTNMIINHNFHLTSISYHPFIEF